MLADIIFMLLMAASIIRGMFGQTHEVVIRIAPQTGFAFAPKR